MDDILVPISVGELLDKISILRIKSQKIANNHFIQDELKSLCDVAILNNVYDEKKIKDLYDVNLKLWNIEDEIRVKEKEKKFDETFIDLARKVYITNDLRAKIKREINESTKSKYREVKSYI